MPRKLIDETGNRYGRLIVIKFARIGRRGTAYWLCQCDCGNETIVEGKELRKGSTEGVLMKYMGGQGSVRYARAIVGSTPATPCPKSLTPQMRKGNC